jgi:hypothetical protein
MCTGCGRSGEPCCNGGPTGDEAYACGAGLVCGTGDTCTGCGAAGQPCCIGETACTTGLTCAGAGANRKCTAPPDAATDAP